jgi:hypothetical protein
MIHDETTFELLKDEEQSHREEEREDDCPNSCTRHSL